MTFQKALKTIGSNGAALRSWGYVTRSALDSASGAGAPEIVCRSWASRVESIRAWSA
jgi:hypothetical protein